MSGSVAFRVAYARYGELRDDVNQQMIRGGLLVKVHAAYDLMLDTPAELELVLPDGTSLRGAGRVLQVLTGFGVAVSVDAELVDQARRAASRPDVVTTGTARHERVDLAVPPAPPRTASSGLRSSPARDAPSTRPPIARTASTTWPPLFAPEPPGAGLPPRARLGTPPPGIEATPPRTRQSTPPPPGTEISPPRTRQSTPPPGTEISPPRTPSLTPPVPLEQAAPAPARTEGPNRLEKVQKALHGTRDERNAILRDRDRTLHPFVLKNPQLDADDVLAIAKNAQMTPDLLKLIGERKEWFQRPAIALALARNPKTPSELAVRALEHVPLEALRQMAKGTGVPPHVTQAARKKLLG